LPLYWTCRRRPKMGRKHDRTWLICKSRQIFMYHHGLVVLLTRRIRWAVASAKGNATAPFLLHS
jgi:hypothetical protein